MKSKILLFLVVVPILFSCSSDEPEIQDKWAIGYMETFCEMHNDSDEVKAWFYNHTNDLCVVRYSNRIFDDYIEYKYPKAFDWRDYSKWLYGEVGWVEYVDNATEEEILLKVEEFKSFTIGSWKDNKFDIYEVRYERIK